MRILYQIIFIASLLVHATYAAPKFLTISDIHYGAKNTSAMGEDTGPEFLKIALNKMHQLSKKADFILFLGDIPTHGLYFNTQKKEYEKAVFDGLFENDSDSKPIFYIPGNNDSLAGNYGPFEYQGISPLHYATHWDGACAHCKGLMLDDSQMRHHGYYSSYVIPENKDIILIALNATQWTQIPKLSSYPNQKKDALEQLGWLEQQLKKHQAKELLIAMHEPPGNSYRGTPIWHKNYLKHFIHLISKYQASYGEITVLTSHTHMDEFRKIKLTPQKNLYIYSTPSISRIHYNFPAIKIFSFTKGLKIKDFTTYYTTKLMSWNKQKYNALSTPNAIFPNCQNKTLTSCLDGLSKDQLCSILQNNKYFQVNPQKQNATCTATYIVDF